MCFCSNNRDLVSELASNVLQLWELPPPLRDLYFLGENYGYQQGLNNCYQRIEKLEAECDRLYTHASQGSFTKATPQLGSTYPELCRIRGEDALADQLEADWKALLSDEELSRQQLLIDRNKRK